jgi:hypothetical protein
MFSLLEDNNELVVQKNSDAYNEQVINPSINEIYLEGSNQGIE